VCSCILLHLILISSATRHTYLNDPTVCVPSFVIVTYKFPLGLLLCKHVTDVKGGSLYPFVRTEITSEPRLLVTVFVFQFTKEMELQKTENSLSAHLCSFQCQFAFGKYSSVPPQNTGVKGKPLPMSCDRLRTSSFKTGQFYSTP
jgi:hypothetical protein